MKNILFGGAAAAALVSGTALLAQAAPAAMPMHGGHKMTQTELRTDVPGHVAKMFARLDANRDGFITKTDATCSQG
jgi:hypothetical protein